MGESPGKMYALAVVLTLLAIAAVLLRLYARRITKQRLEWDDYMIFSALVGSIDHSQDLPALGPVKLKSAAAFHNRDSRLHVRR